MGWTAPTRLPLLTLPVVMLCSGAAAHQPWPAAAVAGHERAIVNDIIGGAAETIICIATATQMDFTVPTAAAAVGPPQLLTFLPFPPPPSPPQFHPPPPPSPPITPHLLLLLLAFRPESSGKSGGEDGGARLRRRLRSEGYLMSKSC